MQKIATKFTSMEYRQKQKLNPQNKNPDLGSNI